MRLAAKDRREQLIETAMRLFSTHGFHGTSTQQIAKAAHVNEAIIFRHFPSKEELYWAVVASRASVSGRRPKIIECLNMGLDERETLALIAGRLLDRTKKDAALTRLLLFSSLRNRKLSDGFFRTYIAGSFELLADYFRKGTREGYFSNVDPLIAARGFLGMITYHYLVQEVLGGSRYQRFDPYTVGRQLSEIWLDGVSARAVPRNGSSKHSKKMVSKPDIKESNNGVGKKSAKNSRAVHGSHNGSKH
jgi:AcrR family transcriptional regulator